MIVCVIRSLIRICCDVHSPCGRGKEAEAVSCTRVTAVVGAPQRQSLTLANPVVVEWIT